MRYSMIVAGVAAVLTAGTAAAETRVKVTNTTPNPAEFTMDGKSKTIRPRKAMSFPVEGPKPSYSVYFANGVADRGELDFSYSTPVTGEKDGVSYHCLTLLEDGMEIELEDACAKRVNK